MPRYDQEAITFSREGSLSFCLCHRQERAGYRSYCCRPSEKDSHRSLSAPAHRANYLTTGDANVIAAVRAFARIGLHVFPAAIRNRIPVATAAGDLNLG